jgi:hypothetical protein
MLKNRMFFKKNLLLCDFPSQNFVLLKKIIFLVFLFSFLLLCKGTFMNNYDEILNCNGLNMELMKYLIFLIH